MRRLFAVVMFGAVLAALAAFACGPGNDKPPLTPDSEHSPTEITEGGAPAPAPSNPIAK